MAKRGKQVPVDKLRFYRNTVCLEQFPGPNNTAVSNRFGFFTCENCDVPDHNHGFLLPADVEHLCVKCGITMIIWIRL